MKHDGTIPKAVLKIITQALSNDLAVKHLPRCLEVCRENLEVAHIHIMTYGQVDLCCVRFWNTSARLATLNIPFINQDHHDMTCMEKINLLHNN
jgi:hypothetical protein